MDDSQSVELRDRAGMTVTVLTLQQFWIAPPALAMTRTAAEVAHFVGWVVRRMGRAQRNPSPSRAAILMGIAALHPSYKSGSLAKPSNSDCPVDFVLEAHFRLKSDIAPCSFRAPRVERFPPASRMRHSCNNHRPKFRKAHR